MRVIETSLDEDLSLFSSWLWQRRIVHRVFEERGAQVLEVRDEHDAGPVRQAYQAWKTGGLTLEARPAASAKRTAARWPRALARYPGLTVLIALTLAAFPFSYLLAQGQLTTVAAWLTIVDPRQGMSGLPTLGGAARPGTGVAVVHPHAVALLGTSPGFRLRDHHRVRAADRAASGRRGPVARGVDHLGG